MKICFYYLYSLVTFVIGLFLVPFFLLHKRGRRNVLQRLGLINFKDREGEVFWVHVASLGELKGVKHLLDEMFEVNQKFILSSVSISALDEIKRTYPDMSLNIFLLPFDSDFFYRNIFKSFNIKTFIYTESEFWPLLFSKLAIQNIPIVGVNIKLNEKSIKRKFYSKLFFPKVFENISKLFVTNSMTKKVLVKFGVEDSKVHVYGNMKYSDREISRDLSRKKEELFTLDYPLLIIGSIRKGEESALFSALKEIQEKICFNVLIAPRQLEQVSYFMAKLKDSGFNFGLKSNLSLNSNKGVHNFLVLDTLGELSSLYALADIVFIGGSLVKGYGGHNPLEASKYKKLVFMGPYHNNVNDIIELNNDAFKIVNSVSEIKEILLNYNSEKYSKTIEDAYNLYLSHQGIPSKVMSAINL